MHGEDVLDLEVESHLADWWVVLGFQAQLEVVLEPAAADQEFVEVVQVCVEVVPVLAVGPARSVAVQVLAVVDLGLEAAVLAPVAADRVHVVAGQESAVAQVFEVVLVFVVADPERSEAVQALLVAVQESAVVQVFAADPVRSVAGQVLVEVVQERSAADQEHEVVVLGFEVVDQESLVVQVFEVVLAPVEAGPESEAVQELEADQVLLEVDRESAAVLVRLVAVREHAVVGQVSEADQAP